MPRVQASTAVDYRRRFSRQGDVAIVRIPAEMTAEATRAFRAYVVAALVDGDSIEVDLTELTEVDGLECGLLASIVAADKSARAVCSRLMLLGVHGAVAGALAATGLDRRLDVGSFDGAKS